MFERSTERARRAVILAQEEARRLNHNYVGTEHILLGLLSEEEDIASQALYSLSVDLDKARKQVEIIVGYGEEGTGAEAPFTPRTKKVLELALREALQLGHNYIGTEHILLGLARESEDVAARVLSNLDVDPDKVRREVVRRLGGGRVAATSSAGKKSKADNLSLFFEIQSLKKEIRRLRAQVRKLQASLAELEQEAS
jgi:ATP-dependent Clp protease ATP-binding subunit ClpC